MDQMDNNFLQERIDSTKLQIIAYEDAMLELANGAQSYTLDTGQTKQTVTKFNLTSLKNTIDSLYNRLATLEARLTGNGTIIARPCW